MLTYICKSSWGRRIKNYNISYKMRSCFIKKKTRNGREYKMKKRRRNSRKKSVAQLPWDYWRHIQDIVIQRNFLNMWCLHNEKEDKDCSFICVELRKSQLFGFLFFFCKIKGLNQTEPCVMCSSNNEQHKQYLFH